MPHYRFEAEHGGRVAGVDEAGRGPLAGPVLAAAVVFAAKPPRRLAALIDDSKQLSAEAREQAYAALLIAAAAGRCEIAVGAASAAEIGRINILRAAQLAMARAVARLPRAPDLALIDGNQPPKLACAVRAVVGGDALCLSIAAASIVAKVTRDRAMTRLCARWPQYGFAAHKGYASGRHRAALAGHGPCPHHRRGFASVDQACLMLEPA